MLICADFCELGLQSIGLGAKIDSGARFVDCLWHNRRWLDSSTLVRRDKRRERGDEHGPTRRERVQPPSHQGTYILALEHPDRANGDPADSVL
jgi:hypothetical protein